MVITFVISVIGCSIQLPSFLLGTMEPELQDYLKELGVAEQQIRDMEKEKVHKYVIEVQCIPECKGV